jgi:hypothetical protein
MSEHTWHDIGMASVSPRPRSYGVDPVSVSTEQSVEPPYCPHGQCSILYIESNPGCRSKIRVDLCGPFFARHVYEYLVC